MKLVHSSNTDPAPCMEAERQTRTTTSRGDHETQSDQCGGARRPRGWSHWRHLRGACTGRRARRDRRDGYPARNESPRRADLGRRDHGRRPGDARNGFGRKLERHGAESQHHRWAGRAGYHVVHGARDPTRRHLHRRNLASRERRPAHAAISGPRARRSFARSSGHFIRSRFHRRRDTPRDEKTVGASSVGRSTRQSAISIGAT